MTTTKPATTLRRILPFATLAVLVPVMLLPLTVLIPLAGLGTTIALFVALADWAARDAFVAGTDDDAPPDHTDRAGRRGPDYGPDYGWGQISSPRLR